MARIVLVVGGCRSGKSAYAQRLAESLPPPRLYVATCPALDPEMACRIEAHQAARRGRGWETVEDQVDLAGVLRRHGEHNVLLVDCVTLWINNLMYRAHAHGDCPDFREAKMGLSPSAREITEPEVVGRSADVLEAARGCRGTVIFVSNEVGLGIVPDNAAARRYRDLVGRANQEIAARADTVTFMSCGIPWHLKGDCPL